MSDSHDAVVAEVVASTLDATVVQPSEAVLTALVETLVAQDTPPSVRILASETRLKFLRRDFLLASRAAMLVDQGVLSLRSSGDIPTSNLVVTQDRVTSIVTVGEAVDSLCSHDDNVRETVADTLTAIWNDSGSFNLRTPALSALREGVKAEFGSDVASDFETALDILDDYPHGAVDEIVLLVLLAAKHKILQYDLGRWAEDIGLASRASISRTKCALKEQDRLATESVPTEVGRPRQRLQLGDELQDAAVEDLVEVATGW